MIPGARRNGGQRQDASTIVARLAEPWQPNHGSYFWKRLANENSFRSCSNTASPLRSTSQLQGEVQKHTKIVTAAPRQFPHFRKFRNVWLGRMYCTCEVQGAGKGK
jgi:hypothetical protein